MTNKTSQPSHLICGPADSLERIERVQALAAGQYWRALVDGGEREDDIKKGMVLLVLAVKLDQDKKPHTVALRPHPSLLSKKHYYVTEHRYLVADFLDLFEPAHDAAQVREQEIAAAQAQVSALQAKLLSVQSDPQAMHEAVVAAGLLPAPQAQSAGGALMSRETQAELAQAAAGTLAGAIGSGLTTERVEAMKSLASQQHALAQARASYLKSVTEEMSQAITAITPFFEEQAAAALASTEQVRDYVSKLMDGIQSLDLYVGTGVKVRTLSVGTSAPAAERLTVMQKKLFADEELCVFLPVEEWFDISRCDEFFDALAREPGLVAQILPAARCVVAMGTTRRLIDYGHAVTDEIMKELNEQTFLLIRDGENLHCVWSPVTSHARSDRLFPTKDEHDRLFRGYAGEAITMADVRYTDRLQAHDESALSYKRFLILAAGLDHRLGLFGRFYEGPQGLDFISAQFQERYLRFISDDDPTMALDGTHPYPPLDDYLREHNGRTQAGSRVMYNARALMNPLSAPAACKHPPYGSTAEMDRPYRAVKTFGVQQVVARGQDLLVKIPVAGESREGRLRKFDCAVSLTAFERSQWHNELAYLCLDAVTPQALSWYIHHRASRQDFLHYIRFFKEAHEFVRQEREEQEESRQALSQALLEGHLGDAAQHEQAIEQAVIAWRAAHQGAELPAPNGKGWESLLAQLFSLVAHRDDAWSVQSIEALAQDAELTALRWVVTGKGQDVLYTAVRAGTEDDRLQPFAWVRRIQLQASRKGALKFGPSTWVLMPKSETSETVKHEWSDAPAWIAARTGFKTPQHKQAAFDLIQAGVELISSIGRGNSDTFEWLLSEWKTVRRRINLKSRYVAEPDLVIPVGMTRGKRDAINLLCVRAAHAGGALARMAPARKDEIMGLVASLYQDESQGKKKMTNYLDDPIAWRLALMPLPAPRALDPSSPCWFDAGARAGVHLLPQMRGGLTSPLLDQQFEDRESKSSPDTWAAFTGTAGNQEFKPVPDAWVLAPGWSFGRINQALGLSMPKDWAVTDLASYRYDGCEITLICPSTQERPEAWGAALKAKYGPSSKWSSSHRIQFWSVALARQHLFQPSAVGSQDNQPWQPLPISELKELGIDAQEAWMRVTPPTNLGEK